MSNSKGSRERVLVIVLAETRSYEHTFDLFKKNLLDVMNADLCLCVAKNDREDTDNPFYRSAKYVWKYDEPHDWGDAFDDLQASRGLNGNWRRLIEIRDQWLGGVKGPKAHEGSAGILLFFRLFLKKSIVEHGVLNEYDRFIVTRSDFVHRSPHVPLRLLHPRFIWIPYGEDYGGFTDRHIVTNRSDILSVLSISDPVIESPDELYAKMSFFRHWNFEKYIRWSFKQLGIDSKVRRFPYTMYSVRAIDGHSRWSHGRFSEEHGYFIKYDSEYFASKLAWTLVAKASDWNRVNFCALMTIMRIARIQPIRRLKRKLKSFAVVERFLGISPK